MTEVADNIDVLYVGDESTVAETVETRAESLRIEAVTAADDALDRLEAASFDCLVSEQSLPESTGIELLRTVRADEPTLPFVLFPDDGSQALASDAISAGVTEYVRRNGTSADRLAAGIRDAVEQCRQFQSEVESQRRLSLFIEQSPLGVIEWNECFEIVAVNPAAEDILGYTESELIGQSWERIVPESDRNEVAQLVDRLREGADRSHNVNRNVRKDGERIICEWHNRVVTDETGDIVAIYSQFQDITNRRTRREAIANLHDIVDDLSACSTREAIYQRTVDAAGRVLDFDRVVVAIEEDGCLAVRAASDAFPLDERTTVPAGEGLLGETHQTGDSLVVDDVREHPAQPQGDAVRAVLSVPISDEGVFQVVDRQEGAFDQQDLELARLLVQHAETALSRLQREQQLEQIRERVEFALDTTDSVVWAVDLESGEITTKLGPSKRLFGLDDQEVTHIEGFFENAVHPDDTDRVRSIGEQTAAGENEFDVVYRTNADDEQSRWVESTGYRRSDDQSRLIGLTTDVTERERRERELERQNERLEEFASVVSHDLRNPLQVADSWLELARDDPKTEYLDNIAQAHERMDVLIEELLRLAREGDRALETERIDLAACCRACWQTVDTVEATLSVEVDWTLTADRNRFRQLLANLFRNAVEHGGGDVTVTVGRLPDGFYVEDDGPGIPLEHRNEVFESGHSATEDGTGFGLSIVARVADAHGWEVQVTEGSTGGARFEITAVSSLAE